MGIAITHAAKQLEFQYEKSKGRMGYVCAQVNPARAADRDCMLSMARRFHAWAPNIAVKLPATAAGLDVLEDCTAEGITATLTISYTVPQVIDIAERHRREIRRAEQNGKEPGKCALAHTIRSDYPQHFSRPYGSTGHRQVEGFIVFGHFRELKKDFPVRSFIMGPFFKDNRGVPEPYVLFYKETLKVLVNTDTDPFGAGDNTKDCRFPIAYMHCICEHVKNREIMLDEYYGALRSQFADQLGSGNPLVNIQKRSDFIKEIQICIPCKTGCYRNSLQFPATQRPDIMVQNHIELEYREDFCEFIALIGCL